jgi:hypothetical protein
MEYSDDQDFPTPRTRRGKQSLAGYLFAKRLTSGDDGKLYEKNLQARLLAGTLAPALEILILHYLYGKPVERLEIEEARPSLEGLTATQLRERALAIARAHIDEAAAEAADAVH